MGLLLKEKACISTGISGVILRNGEPIPNLTVRRKLSWKTDEWDNITEVITDKNGAFSFESYWQKVRLKLMTQPVFHARIVVIDKLSGEEEIIFNTAKLGLEEFEEFEGVPTNFRCELSEERRKVDTKYGFIGTNCYWELIKKES